MGGVKKPDESYGYLLWLDDVYTTCPGLGLPTILKGDARLWVRAGNIYGLAAAYTRDYVYVSWHSALGTYLSEWLPAVGVHSVPDDQWHGLPLVD